MGIQLPTISYQELQVIQQIYLVYLRIDALLFDKLLLLQLKLINKIEMKVIVIVMTVKWIWILQEWKTREMEEKELKIEERV